MKPFRNILLVLLAFCLFCVPARAERPKKDVLFLNSYHQGYQWSDSILEGVRSVLDSIDYKIDLQIEYMDAKKYNYEDVTGMLRRLYREKFAHKKFDAIIVSDNDAFAFASQYRDELFPGVPLIFCGVNDFKDEMMDQGNLTGVVENFDPQLTMEVALKLYPNKRHMVVVGDESTAGVTIRNQVLSAVPDFGNRLTVESWTKLSLEDTLKRVEKLPPDAFLFFIPYYQTVGSRFYTAEEVMEEIYKHSSVPTYTAWSFLLGHGALGGWLISGSQHGRLAAEMTLRILGGEPAASIPVIREPTGEYAFDYNVLSRLGIDMSKLPKGSHIINTPKAFYELPKELFWTIMVSLVLLLIIMVLLVLAMTERRKVELMIKDQLAFQETLMDAVPQLVSWKDRSGKYLGSNRAFTDFFGLDRQNSPAKKTSSEMLPDSDYAKWADEADMAVIRKAEAFRKVRRELLDASGRTSWLEVTKVPIRDRSARIVGVLTTAENVTKERDLERQLLQSQKMEAIGTLAGGIAHDFNNILTSIINSTELAVGDLDEESVTRKDLDRVLKAARRGGRVVNQILAFSRPSTEGFRNTDVGAVVTEAMGLVEASMPSNIRIRLNVAPALSYVFADPTQLHQVAMNLCTNAFHALREKGGIIEACVDRADLGEDDAFAMGVTPGEYVRMTIEDNGPGIDPKILDKIFDPFFSTKDKTEGTGLGLAVVHGIVRSHRGGLQVLQRPGGGTIFEIYLPRADKGGVDTDRVRLGFPTGQRILFVEDDEDQLYTTPRLLRVMGQRVTAIGDPEEAAQLVAEDPTAFDLIISDYDMPGLSGTELAARVSLVAPDLPIILISGREDAMAAAVGLPGIRQVIIKPYDKDDLGDAIGAVLGMR
ncbi:ABC transporter substrate binding protein [Pseudodesulfovibrio sp.]|uniref:hybrid sensor histidine kinase/response regulator n=1 Tax=unclassified Pseudodesulfovibrio TaxID=2661612 RepID=UPI003B00F0D6